MGARWIGTIAIAATMAFALPASAGEMNKTTDVKQAEQFAEQAYEAYSTKDYPSAVTLYLKALELVPSADVIYNVAKIYDTKLKDRELAMTFYRKYISDPGADPDRVRKANERLSALREAEAAANEPAPLAPQRGPARAGDAQAPAPPPEESGLSGVQASGLVMGGLGLVGLGLGTGFGLSAMSSADDANALCDGNDCRTQEGVDASESASSAATISTVGFTVGGALLVSGTLLLLFGGNSKSAASDTASVELTPVVNSESAALGLSGRW